ncbi:MAG: hypothetical protein F6K37_01180 [Moorea sp. SIO4E2]|uniref:hypothetical protein n=1 Tax=Moorena sp. SIO4E2 TaxID=2607826 RepID=UPI0013B610F0|nr:hypothetical protein [Moorena sp. SIO4E2]NEQ04655.1 hypothetical protein [Moorena sp. SIO4E2]
MQVLIFKLLTLCSLFPVPSTVNNFQPTLQGMPRANNRLTFNRLTFNSEEPSTVKNLQPVNFQLVNFQLVNFQPVNLQLVNLPYGNAFGEQPVNLQPVNLQKTFAPQWRDSRNLYSYLKLNTTRLVSTTNHYINKFGTRELIE